MTTLTQLTGTYSDKSTVSITPVPAALAAAFEQAVNANPQPAPTPPANMLSAIPPTSDGIASKLKSGMTLLYGQGNFTNTATLNLPSNVIVDAAGSPPIIGITSPAGRNIDCFAIGKGVTGVSLSNIIGQSAKAMVACVVSVNGSGNVTLNNLRQLGSGRVLNLNGTTGVNADLLYADTGSSSDYCSYWSSQNGGNYNVVIKRMSLWGGPGTPGTPGINNMGAMHAIRMYCHYNCTLGDYNLSLPDGEGKGNAIFLKQSGVTGQKYGWDAGEAINCKNGDGLKIIRALIKGKASFCPLDLDLAAHPEYRTSNLLIDQSEFWTHGYVNFGSGCVGATVKDSIIRAVAAPVNGVFDATKLHGSCLALGGGNGAWPAASVNFINTKFYGPQLIDSGSKALLQNCTFTGCTLNDKPIGLHGE